MAQYEEQNQLDYRQGGDTVDDFAQKYMKEISRIYQFLNNLREHNSKGVHQVEPQPYQLKAEDGKIYIRSEENDEWFFLFDVKYRMGLVKSAESDILTTDDITDSKEPGKLVRLNEAGILPVDIAGNAGKIAGIINEINNLQDGQVLTYRAASNSWRNEDKGVVGSGRAMAVKINDALIAEYAGDASNELNFVLDGNTLKVRNTVTGNSGQTTVEKDLAVVALETDLKEHNAAEDAHAGLLKQYAKTVNNTAPDKAGNVELGGLVKTINGVAPDEAGNVDISGANIGDIKWSSVDLTQVGWLVATGAEVGRDTYTDLNEYYASKGYPWGAGDGATTFNLPNLIGRFPEGADSAGGYKEAGLPNIEGTVRGLSTGKDTGAFQQIREGFIYGNSPQVSTNEGSYANTSNFVLKASSSSPIYGKSNTVQPPSALLIPYVKAFKGASAESTDLEISKVANDVVRLSGRVHLVDSKVNEDGSWYRVWSDGWTEQGGITTGTLTSSGQLVTFIQPFVDTSYTLTYNIEDTSAQKIYTGVYSKTTTTAMLVSNNTSANIAKPIRWKAEGMGANV